ncbi:hypothetical protein EXT55_22115 [Pectobacterium carotovorum subsp. carotovorum]|nr:hypothetical protein [Pectobacterium carotovorum subsp. carotovorum]
MINNEEKLDLGDGSISAKIASLTFIQAIVARMASNSLKIKTFFIGFLGVFITIKTNFTGVTTLSYLIPLIIAICSCYLDSYYLMQERIFRHVYNEKSQIKPNIEENFFNIKDSIKENSSKETIIKTMKSPSITPFYLTSLLFIVLINWSVHA